MFFRNENQESPFQEQYISSTDRAPNLTSESQSSTNAEDLHANCPVCRVGVLERKFTKCGIVLAVLFFPLGIVCCFLSSQKKCNRCGYDEGI
ncbi:Brain protein I3-like Protein [Tribolium castaneum]|uniref:Membrane protein BRI3 n=1 Tax=Tribolium castaneum TaxID=7070 RepID=D6WVR2_TRICA|nr:Brain protein I3-like Protein [Tribolium castaneum]